jgi:hypothetical protein
VSVEVAEYVVSHTGRGGEIYAWLSSRANPVAKRTLPGSRRVEQNDFVTEELSLTKRVS